MTDQTAEMGGGDGGDNNRQGQKPDNLAGERFSHKGGQRREKYDGQVTAYGNSGGNLQKRGHEGDENK